jgi:hypothetical protein
MDDVFDAPRRAVPLVQRAADLRLADEDVEGDQARQLGRHQLVAR